MKNGLDFFSVSCVESESIELIEAEFGMVGFGVVYKLLGRIYGQNGYFCRWDEDCELLFARKHGIKRALLSSIVAAAIKRGIFDREMHERYGILTSREIQSFFLHATKRRKDVTIDARYRIGTDGRVCDAHKFEPSFGAGTAEALGGKGASAVISADEADSPFWGIAEPAEPYVGMGSDALIQAAERGEKDEAVNDRTGAIGVSDGEKRAYGRHRNIMLTEKEHLDVCHRIRDAEHYIDKFSRKLKEKGYQYADHYSALISWWEADSVLPKASTGGGESCSSFDTDEFFAAATRRASARVAQGKEPA